MTALRVSLSRRPSMVGSSVPSSAIRASVRGSAPSPASMAPRIALRGIAHQGRRAALVAENPAPAAGDQHAAVGRSGDGDRAGARHDADAAEIASRGAHQLGIVDDLHPGRQMAREARLELPALLVGIAAMGADHQRAEAAGVEAFVGCRAPSQDRRAPSHPSRPRGCARNPSAGSGRRRACRRGPA